MCASPENIRRIMLTAYDLDMVETGDYAFFNTEIFSGTSGNNKPWYNASDTDEQNLKARKAYDAVLTVSARTPSIEPYLSFSREV
ncbi:hypothetical protein SK128_007626, partial [Halocaridina rubra]